MVNALLQGELLEIEGKRGFEVNGIDGVNWCFRKIRALKEKKEEIDRIANEELSRITTWRDKENEGIDNSIEYFEGLITEYYLKIKREDPKAKLSTPYGKVTSRKNSKWNYNEDEVKQWCKSSGHTELIRLKEELDKSTLKKTFKDGVDTETGEVIPGISIVEEESISIKVE
ncbi:host-nuclease inhibitor Gam family protein [Clostridium sp. Marseille-QA1073]